MVLEASPGRRVLLRLVSWLLYLLIAIPILVPRAAGMMLLGMACARRGWILRPAEHRGAFRRLAILGLGLGIPIQIAATAYYFGDPSPVDEIFSLLLVSLASIQET